MSEAVITRMAPSPTGFLHLGNIWAFFLTWLAARSQNGKVYLRIDDIDFQRCRKEYINAIYEDLKWLGLDWDQDMSPALQSERQDNYERALKKLESRIYPCFCSRKELKALSSAPHPGETTYYPGICRYLSQKKILTNFELKKQFVWRLKCPNSPVYFQDRLQGKQIYNPEQYGGDFPLKRSDGSWSYQFATAIDDSKINFVLRGKDLLDSTPRQLIIMDYLQLPRPQYAHAPLLLDTCGERLAKRHNSLCIKQLRENGIKPETIIGYLAYLANLNPSGKKFQPKELIKSFNLDILPNNDIRICEADLNQF